MSLKIVFMGTPAFAVPSLEELRSRGHDIPLVVTRPDAPKGRGLAFVKSDVKICAEKLSIPTIDANNLKDPHLLEVLRNLKPDLFAVVAFMILPRELLAVPRLGCINLHPSLLPKYRGAAPIQWALANGELETGISIIKLSEVIDGGDIIKQEKFPIFPADTTLTLSERLSKEGARLLCEAVADIERNTVKTVVQNSNKVTPAPKLRKEDGLIDFSLDAISIINRIRAFNPFPGTFTYYEGKRLFIVSAEAVDGCGKKGEVIAISKSGITISLDRGAILIKKVKPEGRSEMEAYAYANGKRIGIHSFFNI